MRHPASVPAISSRAISSEAAQPAIRVRYGNDRRTGLFAASPAATIDGGRSLAATIRDLVLIALAWALFVGIMMYPVAQIAGIFICAIALLLGSARRRVPAMATI